MAAEAGFASLEGAGSAAATGLLGAAAVSDAGGSDTAGPPGMLKLINGSIASWVDAEAEEEDGVRLDMAKPKVVEVVAAEETGGGGGGLFLGLTGFGIALKSEGVGTTGAPKVTLGSSSASSSVLSWATAALAVMDCMRTRFKMRITARSIKRRRQESPPFFASRSD